MWRFSTERRSEPAQKCTIVPRNNLNDLQRASLQANVVYLWDTLVLSGNAALWDRLGAGLCAQPAQREDEYGLRARSETTSNNASSTKFMTTEEPP